MSSPTDSPSLYGNEDSKGAPRSPMSLGDYLQGVFTAPVETARRLSEAPTWLAPMGVILLTGLLLSVLWLWKMDPVAMVQGNLDVTGRWMSHFGQTLPDSAVQQALDNAKRPVIGTLAGTLLGTWVVFGIMALIVWGGARIGTLTDREPATFTHAFGVVVFQAVPLALTQVLALLIALLKPVGGLTIMALNPGSLGYFLTSENLLVRGVTVGLLDPLYLFSWVLLALGMRHTLKAKTWAIILTLVLVALVAIPARMVGGMY